MEVAKNEDIDEININIRLDNLNEFQEFQSKVFYVSGNPWLIKLRKFRDECLLIQCFLHPLIADESDTWAIVGKFSVKIIATDYSKDDHERYSEPFSIHSESRSYLKCIIKWKELMDPENGFIENNSCKIEIKVRASPVQTLSNDKWLKFETIKNCCNNSSEGIFRVTVKHFNDAYGVCSAKIVLRSSSWRLMIHRMEDSLVATLSYFKFNSFHVTVLFKLIPFDSSIEPFQIENDEKHFSFSQTTHDFIIIPWDKLIKPENQFMQNKKFVLEIKIIIKSPDEQRFEREKRAIELICSICLESLIDGSISALTCGHMFCTECIENSL